ncbi:S53 family peptidase [Ideonella sp. A 288]|uniref:S53 family peptidase n=1 Tax=Ideonella sp. A 288 TaxID=1962181 RepID=UPI000B4B2C10|nr:S53 family peptidase [Ideonella sp. A 288]
MHTFPETLPPPPDRRHLRRVWLAACAAAALSACGGGSNDAAVQAEAAAPLATGTTTLELALDTPAADAARVAVQPTFHIAPVLLAEPDDSDARQPGASAQRGPRTQSIPADQARLSTRGLTLQGLEATRRQRALGVDRSADDATTTPLAGSGVVSTYSPAQIRAAYGLPALPAAGTPLTATQAAQLGAGQTIYIVNAMHDPNIVAELAAFNQKFGLPGCTTKAIAPTTPLPLPAASTQGCEFSVVYATANATMTATAPAYESGWATEIALDVQWAHATAPLARIVLIEAPSAMTDTLTGAIRLANAMGPGPVSMSFGATEGSWGASLEGAFTGSGMTYLAATGDWGTQVSWPAVSTRVLAVGGTTLSYSGSGPRSEVAWASTGGGISLYTARPAYQTHPVPGLGTPVRRTVADVAFNADPGTGQYVAVMSPGSSTVNWISAGGTSLSTPQWAGLVAIANALRALDGKATLGAPHDLLYANVGSVPGTYASTFADIVQGSHGTCATCTAKVGFDQLTGLGTPQVGSLLAALSGATTPTPPPAATAPVVTSATVNGKVGTALSFTVAATAPNAVTWTLGGAPSGMAINSAGVVTWATPVLGTRAVTVTARDSQTGLTGQGTITVTIAAAPAPVVAPVQVSGKVGTALAARMTVTPATAVTWSLTGAPSGMSINSSGAVAWARPVAGTYTITVNAKDKKTGLTGQGTLTVVIAPALAPVVAAVDVAGKVGTALSTRMVADAANPVTWSLSGAPSGMTINASGSVTWARPVAGTYTVTATAKDSRTALTGQGRLTVTIAAAATTPTITAAAMRGVAGKALSGSISVADVGATSLSITIAGAPLGMGFTMSGQTIGVHWASPVTGSYSLKVTVTNQAGRSAQATVPVTITAK